MMKVGKHLAVATILTLLNILYHIHTLFGPEKHTTGNFKISLKNNQSQNLGVFCPPVHPVKEFPVPSPFNMDKYQRPLLLQSPYAPICNVAWKNNRVFLLETKRTFIIPKVLCTLESLASHMPNWCITLFVLNYDESKSSKEELRLLSRYPNIQIFSLSPNEAVAGTPLEGIFKTRKFDESVEKLMRATHYNEVIRAALLYRYGGIYVDLDVIALKSLDLGPQYLVRTSSGGISTGLIKFNRWGFMLLRYVANVWTDYAAEHFSTLTYVLCDVVEDHCKHMGLQVKGIDMKSGHNQECDGVTIFHCNSSTIESFSDSSASKTVFNQTHAEMYNSLLTSANSALLWFSGWDESNYNIRVKVKTDNTVYARQFRLNCPICTRMFDEV